MKLRTACAALAALMLAAPASAEPRRLAQALPGVLPPYEIMTILRSTGLDPLTEPTRRGPIYVLRAIDDDDREVRVVVDARSGEVMSIAPVATASRLPPRGVMIDPYDRPPPSARYVPPRARDFEVERAEPPLDDEDEALPDFRRPRAAVPLPSATRAGRSDAPSGPQVITAIEPGRDGLLPPPPERFPQRAPPVAEKPKPQKRAVASVPKEAPLPRPRPQAGASPSPGDAAAAPPASKSVPMQH